MNKYLTKFFILFLSANICIASNYENIFQEQYKIPANLAWRQEIAPIVNRAFKLLGSGNNVATFRLKATADTETEQKKETYKDFSKLLFVSGGDKERVAELKKQIGYTCYNIYDFYPIVENQPADRTLRQDIASFFELVNLQSRDLTSLQVDFNVLLEKIPKKYLNNLKPALETAFQSNTTLRTFHERNNKNLTVEDIELINTSRKGNKPKPNHFDDVFGDNFLRNFADSEQSIRKFMTRGTGTLNIIGENIDFNFTDGSIYYPSSKEDAVYTFCQNYIARDKTLKDTYNNERKEFEAENKKYENDLKDIKIKYNKDKTLKDIYDKKKKELEARNKNYENDLNEIKTKYSTAEDTLFAEKEKDYKGFLSSWLKKINLSFEVEIFSYFQMCSNCKATFKYDSEYRHLFQRDILVSFLSGLSDNPIKNCFKTLLLTKNIQGIQFPEVKLNINYTEKYGD